MNRSTLLRWLIGSAIGVLFIWLAASEWPLGALFGGGVALRGATLVSSAGWSFHLTTLIPYLAVLCAIHFLRVIRWRPLVEPLGRVDLGTLNRVSGIGNMYLFVLPLRLGELARPYYLARETQIPVSAALGTIAVERVADGLIVSLLLGLTLPFLPDGKAAVELRWAAGLALAVFVGALVVLLGLVMARQQTLGLIRTLGYRISRPLTDKVVGVASAFIDGLAALPSRRHIADFLGWSVVYWALNGYGYYVLAMGFPALHVPLVLAYAMMGCVVVGMMLPNPPANVGVYWYFLLKPITLYGVAVGDPSATVFGLVAWGGQLVQQTAFGLVLAARSERLARRLAEARLTKPTAADARPGSTTR